MSRCAIFASRSSEKSGACLRNTAATPSVAVSGSVPRSAQSPKYRDEIRDTPQEIVVIPQKIFEEQSATTLVDLSGVKMAGVPGKTTTTIALGPGGATLNGTVAGPDGAVGGATIHVERLVGDAVASRHRERRR